MGTRTGIEHHEHHLVTKKQRNIGCLESAVDAIMSMIGSMVPGEDFELLAPFDPLPLYEVLGSRCFSHHTEPLEGGDYRVVFRRDVAESG